MKEISFLALEPPGNIVKPYYLLQETLFRSFGMTTARLFPPIIPVAVLPPSRGQAALSVGRTVAAIRSGLESTVQMRSAGGLHSDGKIVFVPVETVPPTLFGDYDPEPIFFPKQPGILLGLRENTGLSDAELSALGPIPLQTWNVIYIAEIHITYSVFEPYFEEAEWKYSRYEKAVCGGSV